MAGVLDAKQYFDTADAGDQQVRALADSLYHRVDWEFMRSGGNGIRMGWKPGTGFGGYGYWIGYNEAMILYLLALGSPTHPVPALDLDLLDQRLQLGQPVRHRLRDLPAAVRAPVLPLLDRFPQHPGRSTCATAASPTTRTRGGRPWRRGPTASPTRTAGPATGRTCGA